MSLWAPEKGLKVSTGKGIYDIDVQTFYDCVDLENKVKVKFTTCNKRSCQYAPII